jgi:hypothetical protein
MKHHIHVLPPKGIPFGEVHVDVAKGVAVANGGPGGGPAPTDIGRVGALKHNDVVTSSSNIVLIGG